MPQIMNEPPKGALVSYTVLRTLYDFFMEYEGNMAMIGRKTGISNKTLSRYRDEDLLHQYLFIEDTQSGKILHYTPRRKQEGFDL